ncbi:suppressor of fused domain protein [Flavobacterium ginsengiterrae]
MNELLDREKEFIFDIYHSVVLNNYIKYWGMPEYRVISTREKVNEKIYVYYFPCNKKNKICRVATVGLSLQSGLSGKVRCEYIFTLPCDLGNTTLDSVFNYMLDIAAHTVFNISNVLNIPRVMSSRLAPNEWKTKAILFDELRGEDENFSEIICKEAFNTEFIWVVPIYDSEYLSILNNGIDEFDQCEQESEISIVDVNRDPFIL